MKKKILIIIGVVIGVLALGFGIFMIVMASHFKEQEEVRKMPINEIDLLKVSDGNYIGGFSYGNFTYEVEVLVREHQIENIKILKNRDSKHAKKGEGVVDKVMKNQSLGVDVVTGATTTTKALLKAIENALTKGIVQ